LELVANLASAAPDTVAWARDREAEGYHGVGCSDHLWVGGTSGVKPFSHIWVTIATMAAATTRVRLTTAFANNLLRHPIDVAQASMAMQIASGNRFEAGVGAGWARDEIERSGLVYPDGRTRARMFHESVVIVRELLHTGRCRFEGEHYKVDVEVLGPLPDVEVPLVASVGSPWTMRNITPLVERVELKMGRSTRDGAIDLGVLASVTEHEVRSMIEIVKDVNPAVSVSLLVFVACGTAAEPFERAFGDSLFGSFVGEPGRVAEGVRSLASWGVDRITLTQWVPGSFEAIAPHLLPGGPDVRSAR
jgi:alkanesulfonate monooxygenase SsuD/methylene tetrahydromethanopterin reductase-like flavin-dependent oxidoreductase (luciferase family)